MRIAVAAFPILQPSSPDEAEAALRAWVQDAAQHGAELLVFPEYASLSWTAWLSEDLPTQLAELQAHWPRYQALHQQLAVEHGVYLLAGSFPVREGNLYYNRAVLYGANGQCWTQDKCLMTRFEAEHWGIHAGNALQVLDTPLGKLGVLICYDSEFPLLARRLCEQGADLLLAPSCTDTLAGFHRVRVGCQARALENQCYVLQAPLVGEAAWSVAVDVNVGKASVYGPIEMNVAPTGILAESGWNQAGWLYADLDLPALAEARRNGQVLNQRDWSKQAAFL
jgi:predicted amidohydrolase